MINGVVGAINGMGFDVPDWVPVIGGKKFALNIPTIPMLAKGTSYWAGGLGQINERGGEIVDLPSGTRVYPHDESVRMARRSGMQITIAKIADEVVIREDSDIQKLAAALALEFEKKIYDYAPA
jgi:phage-related protein